VPHGVFFGKGRRGAAAGLRLIVYIIERIKEREEEGKPVFLLINF
jgi:hypothetical protein